MAVLDPRLSVATLNINGLNSPIRGHRVAGGGWNGGGLQGRGLGQLWVFDDHPLVALDLGLQLRTKAGVRT